MKTLFRKTRATKRYSFTAVAEVHNKGKVVFFLIGHSKKKISYCPVEVKDKIYRKHFRELLHETFRSIRHKWGLTKSLTKQ
jgi:hypothetical protein